jgi:hypothetical protein
MNYIEQAKFDVLASVSESIIKEKSEIIKILEARIERLESECKIMRWFFFVVSIMITVFLIAVLVNK